LISSLFILIIRVCEGDVSRLISDVVAAEPV
jgi:hypothetical protein